MFFLKLFCPDQLTGVPPSILDPPPKIGFAEEFFFYIIKKNFGLEKCFIFYLFLYVVFGDEPNRIT